ncbi:MAG: NDP-hexose 2,3-dehydratase family protein [Streptosporangiaceae bacterium]|nr:NDP-hexose 2,3-dehydratase family protein [Streptosporangiaceae bacterium]
MASTKTDRRPAPAPTGDLPCRLAVSARYLPRPAAAVQRWLANRQRRNPFRVGRVPFADLTGWSFAPETGDLVHESGRFFSIEGRHVRTDYGPVPEWWQPIIHQPERAILGILVREIDGVLHFLMQAKMEPGNANGVQLSPTVQSTPSNYLRTHKGSTSRYVEYFTEPGRGRVLVDVLQSEQGSWFSGKRNRNIIIEVSEEVPPHDDFIWLSLGQILTLLHQPNLINMDARTVLSCLPMTDHLAGDAGFRRAVSGSVRCVDDGAWQPLINGRSWLIERKSYYTLSTRTVPLSDVVGWHRDDREIRHHAGRYFRIIGVDVQASNREVARWRQPLLAPCGLGLVAFLLRRIDGVLHVLAHADLRLGYRDTVELGPTVHCTPGNFVGVPDRLRPRYLDLVLSGAGRVRYDVVQSEEGGRFHHALTRHVLIEVDDDFPLDTPPDYTWLTMGQLMALVLASYQLNIEARSLLLCLQALR